MSLPSTGVCNWRHSLQVNNGIAQSAAEVCAFFSVRTKGRDILALCRAQGLGCVSRRLLPTTNRLTDTHAYKKLKDLFGPSMGVEEDKTNTCGTICLKYLLFTFNLIFWLAGGAVAAVGVWTLVDKSEYISLLASSAYSASAYVLILSGVVVVATGVLGCCATFKEHRGFLIVYFVLLLVIFLLEITAGVLAYVYYQELSNELKVNLKDTMVNKYDQPGQDHVTQAVDKLHQDLECCGSNNYTDWRDGAWIKTRAVDRLVPDSCCKTPSVNCGRRDHPSNIYNVEGGCIGKLEEFLLQHLQILGAVGIGLAFIQLVGMIFTCCLYQSLKEDPY